MDRDVFVHSALVQQRQQAFLATARHAALCRQARQTAAPRVATGDAPTVAGLGKGWRTALMGALGVQALLRRVFA